MCQVVVHHTEVVLKVHKTDPGVCDTEGVCLCVCLCVRERARERKKRESVCVCLCAGVCVYVCGRDASRRSSRHCTQWRSPLYAVAKQKRSPLYTVALFCVFRATKLLCFVYSGDCHCVQWRLLLTHPRVCL